MKLLGEYVDQRSGGSSVAGAPVPLDSTVFEFWGSDSPEITRQDLPSISELQ
jgi:hypothetical protein